MKIKIGIQFEVNVQGSEYPSFIDSDYCTPKDNPELLMNVKKMIRANEGELYLLLERIDSGSLKLISIEEVV